MLKFSLLNFILHPLWREFENFVSNFRSFDCSVIRNEIRFSFSFESRLAVSRKLNVTSCQTILRILLRERIFSDGQYSTTVEPWLDHKQTIEEGERERKRGDGLDAAGFIAR